MHNNIHPSSTRLPLSTVRRRTAAWLISAALVATSLLTIATPAQAHATLVKSEPARRAALTTAPSAVRLWFNERLEPAYSTIRVLGEGGGQLMLPPAHVDPQDAKLLVLELPALAPGTYTVQYHVLSVDGHSVDQSHTFTVKPAPARP